MEGWILAGVALLLALCSNCVDSATVALTTCYQNQCKSSVPTKCRLFPRWSSETVKCQGACFFTRNASRSFVHVDRGCVSGFSPGCRPVVMYGDPEAEEYYRLEVCYCNTSLCNLAAIHTSSATLAALISLSLVISR